METKLILGSASERRRKILNTLAVAFSVVVPQVEEVNHDDDPRRAASENALRKNVWCRHHYPGHFIITADTVIDFEGHCIGKPADLAGATDMMRKFSGQPHTVITAVAFSTPDSAPVVRLVESNVTFLKLDAGAIRAYFAGVNPLDKAGAYDIDQRPDLIIESFKGSRTNIMGLPRDTVRAWLEEQELLE